MIDIKKFDSNLLKIDKKSFKNIDISYIGYITMKDLDYVNIYSLNPLYFMDGYTEEINGNKYLMLVSTDKNKELLTKYTELWDKTKYLIKSITNTSGDYDEKYMKIKFKSDDDLPLGKILSLRNMAVVVRPVFQEEKKYCPQVFLDECLYEL